MLPWQPARTGVVSWREEVLYCLTKVGFKVVIVHIFLLPMLFKVLCDFKSVVYFATGDLWFLTNTQSGVDCFRSKDSFLMVRMLKT